MRRFLLVCVILLLVQLIDGRFHMKPGEQFKKLYYTDDGVTRTYAEAKKFCEDHDSVLIQPKSQAELDFVRAFLGWSYSLLRREVC